MKHLTPLLVAALAACTPPLDPPPTTTTTAAATTAEPPGDPPPTTTVPEPEGRDPEDYFVLDNIDSVTESLTNDLQENANQGWRAIIFLYTNCSYALKPNAEAIFPLNHDEAMDFAIEGGELDAEGHGFLSRLPNVNKRCAASHSEHDPRFCGRSDVSRKRLMEFREKLTAHLLKSRQLSDALIGKPGRGVNWDGVLGWCDYQVKHGR